MNFLLRYLLRLWAYIGIGTGYLYLYLDKNRPKRSPQKYWRKISGNNWMACDLRDHVQSQIYFFGAYEPIEAYIFQSLVKEDMNIIDAGTNVGFYSLLCSSKLNSGKVYSFEPIKDNFDKFTNNLERSQKKNNIEPINKGLWSENKELTFSLPESKEHNIGSFSAGQYNESMHSQKAEVVNFDEYSQILSINKVDLIKMDIEGAEMGALKGMEKTLRRDKPTIMLEVNEESCNAFDYEPNDLFNYLSQFGYKAYALDVPNSSCVEVQNFKGIVQKNIFLTINPIEGTALSVWDYKKIKKSFSRNSLFVSN